MAVIHSNFRKWQKNMAVIHSNFRTWQNNMALIYNDFEHGNAINHYAFWMVALYECEQISSFTNLKHLKLYE